MAKLDDLPIHRRIDVIEDALASAFKGGEFEVVIRGGERFLQPIIPMFDASGMALPMLSLEALAQRLERLLS